jgi:hypothetical protein
MSAKEIAEGIEPILEGAQADGSYLLAVCRLDELLSGKNPVSQATVRRAVAMPNEIARKCEEFISSEKFEPLDLKIPVVDLKEMSTLLFEEIGPEWLAEKIGDVSEIDRDSFAMALGNALAFLQQRLPKMPIGRKSPLSTIESASFVRAFRTVAEPMSVLNDMLMGVLSRSQVQVLIAVYPAIHQAMSFGISMAATEALAKDPGYTVPWPKLKQISVLNLSTTVPQDLAGVLQSNFAALNANVNPETGQSVDVATGMSTNAQKLEGK